MVRTEVGGVGQMKGLWRKLREGLKLCRKFLSMFGGPF